MSKVLLTAIFLSTMVAPVFAQDSNPTSLTAKQCKLGGNERIVPNILGFDPKDAQKIIEACDFKYDGATDVHTLSYEAIGTVGDQQPSGGTVAKIGTMVRGFVSKGLYPPDFTGKSTAWNVQDAEKYYRDFRHGVVEPKGERSAAPIGTVIGQKPSNGELYNSGAPLELTYSLGLTVDIPNLKNMEFGDAVRALAKLNLTGKHGTGYFEWKSKQQTNCEVIFYFPAVENYQPKGTVYEGQEIVIDTVKRFDIEFSPKGADGKPCN